MGLGSHVFSIVSHVTLPNRKCLLKGSLLLRFPVLFLTWSHLQIFPFQKLILIMSDFAPIPPSRGGAVTPSVLRRACTLDGAGRCDGMRVYCRRVCRRQTQSSHQKELAR